MGIKNYAVVNSSTGLVVDLVLWDGEAEWAPNEGFEAVQSDTAGIGWTFIDGAFAAPAVAAPSAETILETNRSQQDYLLSEASKAMTPLLLALQLDSATADETAQAKAWQAYYRDLQGVDITVYQPAWPAIPESR